MVCTFRGSRYQGSKQAAMEQRQAAWEIRSRHAPNGTSFRLEIVVDYRGTNINKNREKMNEIIDYIKDSPIEYAIDALSVNYVIQTIVQMVLFPFVLYFCWRVFKNILRNMRNN